MKDLMGLMSQVKRMQERMQEMQESLSSLEETGSSGGGLVSVSLDGKGAMRSVRIDPSLLSPGEEGILEDLLIAAHAEAKAKIDAAIQERSAEFGVGLGLPPGLKLPF